MKLSLERKILAGFVICSLFLLLVAFFSFRNSENFISSTQLVNHTHETLNELEQTLINELDAETGKRGYVITGDEAFLAPFNHAMGNIAQSIDRVRELTKDNPAQQRNIARIEMLTDTLTKFLRSCILIRRTQGFEEARKKVATGEGTRILDDVRATVDNARAVEQKLLDERKQQSEQEGRSFNLVFILLLSLIALVLIGVYVIIVGNLRALKKAEQETAHKNWTLTGSGELI